MAITDKLNLTPGARGSIEQDAIRARRLARQAVEHLGIMVRQMKKLSDKHGAVALQTQLNTQQAGDGVEFATLHAALVTTGNTLLPGLSLEDL